MIEVETEWVETPEGYRLRWDCSECGSHYYTDRFFGTYRCLKCSHLLQSENMSVGSREAKCPDDREKEQEAARSW